MVKTVRFGLQAGPENGRKWIETAQRAEDLGFDLLCVGDHPGGHPSPLVALAAAAAVTSEIELGSYVMNVGLRHPLDIATDTATLDIVSDGRAFLGLGAGHTPTEWAQRDLPRPPVKHRVARLIEVATTTKQLLAGDSVTTGSEVGMVDAKLDDSLQRDVPLLIGGNNRQILRFAASQADVIALTGLGRTLEGGHKHELKWEPHQLEETFKIARSTPEREHPPEIQALVQWAAVTEDPGAIARRMGEDFAVDPALILESPFILIGSVKQILERIERNTERWGIDSYVVRRPSLEGIGQVIDQLR